MANNETQKDQNKKPCRNCGKLMPIVNPYCYSCGTVQKTGEIEPAFNVKKIPLTGNLTYGGSVQKEGLRCVRCDSTEKLEYYNMTKSFEKKEVGAPITTVYRSKPSFKFPICLNCAEKFRKWKIIRFIFVAVAALWIILSIFLLQPLSISNPSLDEIFIRLIYVSIVFIIIIISFWLFSKNKNNPNKWMIISGYFDITRNFKYTGKVHPPNSKEWIYYEKWVEEIKERE